MLRADHLLRGWGRVLFDDTPCGILDAQDGHGRNTLSSVRKHGIGSR